MQEDEIIIRRGIIHILDGELGYPVFSEQELCLSPDINDFFRGHIYRILSGDDLKKCSFTEEEQSEAYILLKQFSEEELISFSKELTSKLYNIMNANVAIPSGDLAILTFQMHGKIYLAILKMNYKESFVHMTQSSEIGNVNQIICYQSTLPATSTRLSEAVIIDLSDHSVQIIEKKYDINGTKVNYLSELFLQCKAAMSSKTKLDIVTKAIEQVNQKHYAAEPQKQMEAKSIIQKEIETKGFLNVEELGEKIYGSRKEVKEEFEAKMEKYHMEKAEVSPQSEKTTKKFEKQYIKTDTGIEIKIPSEHP